MKWKTSKLDRDGIDQIGVLLGQIHELKWWQFIKEWKLVNELNRLAEKHNVDLND